MTVLQKLQIDKQAITFPRLRELRGKHGLSYEALANVMDAKVHQTSVKRLSDGDFTIDEMVKITDYFNNLGENDTIDSIFLNWISTNVKINE